ncbi:hypothetical protein IJ670_01540 [bacterium]|nr:hypothetical protein [bacterium]
MQKESSLLIKNFHNLPIWVKQVIAKELSAEIQTKLSEFFELVNLHDLFQYLAPKITIMGKQELESRSLGLTEGYYIFLADMKREYTIFDTTIKNNWTLADTSKIFTRLYELELVTITPEQVNTNLPIALFISGKIKTGEFLKKIKKINTEQLEAALRYQKQLNEEGRHIKMASILIKMGFISEVGLDSLLLLKEQAKMRVPMSIGLTSFKYEDEADEQGHISRLQREIARLESENLIMKKRLKSLLNIG